jgi:hypothetical protein
MGNGILNTVKPAHAVTSIKQSPVLKGYLYVIMTHRLLKKLPFKIYKCFLNQKRRQKYTYHFSQQQVVHLLKKKYCKNAPLTTGLTVYQFDSITIVYVHIISRLVKDLTFLQYLSKQWQKTTLKTEFGDKITNIKRINEKFRA